MVRQALGWVYGAPPESAHAVAVQDRSIRGDQADLSVDR